VGIEGIGLEHHGDVAPLGRKPGDVPAAYLDTPRVRLLQPGDKPQQGGLAAAGGAKEDAVLTLGYREIDTPDHGVNVEGFV